MKAKSDRKPAAPSLAPPAVRPSNRRPRSNAVLLKPAMPTTNRGRATRERLKEALSALLQRNSFHEIRLEDIASEAGVRVSLIYHYFRSRTDIMCGCRCRGNGIAEISLRVFCAMALQWLEARLSRCRVLRRMRCVYRLVQPAIARNLARRCIFSPMR